MDEGTGVTRVTEGQTSGKQAPINWQTERMSVEERGDAVAMGTGVVREMELTCLERQSHSRCWSPSPSALF